MTEAFIYDHVRTPRGRGKPDGSLHTATTLHLAATALRAIKERNNLDPKLIDDVVMGCVDPVGEAGGRLAPRGGPRTWSRGGIRAAGGAWPVDPALAIPAYFMPQGVSADLIATKYGFSRDDVDAYAVESQKRAAAAWADHRFKHSIAPVRDVNGISLLDHDEHMRPKTDMQSLAALTPAFVMMGKQAGFDAVATQAHPAV